MPEKRKDSKGRNLKDGEDQRPDGSYRFRYNDKAGNRQAVYSWKLVPTDKVPPGKRDGLSLREKEKSIENDIRDGIDGKKAAKLTLNDMFELYMSGKCDLKQSTRTHNRYMYNKFVAGELGMRKIDSIKFSDMKRFFNLLIYDRGFKPNTIHGILTILHPVFTLAVRDGYIRNNPTDGIISELKKGGANWEKPKRHALTVEEQEAFINFVTQSDIYRHWLPLFTVFLGTGCRVSEIIGLRWCDCDFDNLTISINHILTYTMQDDGHSEKHITTPKTAAGYRTIPMLKEVRSALMQERRRQFAEGGCKETIDGYDSFIFTNSTGSTHLPVSINQALERIRLAYNTQEAEQAKKERREPLIIPHFSVHNLRHTFCTRFCENESNVKVIQEVMGHSDISTTMNVYAEATENAKKESFSSLEGKIKIS
ncbi:MAG: tyrosine-type recombinase/integrase [Clostridiales bacterium]|nr:tyrosine-type recombinase/integrase [Clostridiales bacterium]